MLRGAKRYRVVQNCTERCSKGPRGAERYQEVPRGTEVPRHNKRCREVPRCAEKYKVVSRGTKVCQEVLRGD